MSLGMIFYDTLPGGRECVRKHNLSSLPKLLIRKNDCTSYLARLISAPPSLILEQLWGLSPQSDNSVVSLPTLRTGRKKYSLVSISHVIGFGRHKRASVARDVCGYRQG